MPTPGSSTTAGSAPRIAGDAGLGVALVVGGVVGPVLGVELAQPVEHLVERARGGHVEQQRAHLRAQEVVGARGPERHEPRGAASRASRSSTSSLSTKRPTDAAVGRAQAAEVRGDRRRPGPALGGRQRLEARPHRRRTDRAGPRGPGSPRLAG